MSDMTVQDHQIYLAKILLHIFWQKTVTTNTFEVHIRIRRVEFDASINKMVIIRKFFIYNVLDNCNLDLVFQFEEGEN